jgi:hypothetical protein
VMAAIVGFTHLLAEFDTPTLVRLVGTLLDRPYTSRQATYDLRRLKRKGLIVRLSGHHRYQLTPLGRRVAVCSPRPTDGSWPQALPPSTHACLRNWFNEARWPLPGANSTAH